MSRKNSGKSSVFTNKGPGPAAYKLHTTIGAKDHDFCKVKRPMYSFGLRPTIEYNTIGPGPGSYKFKSCDYKYGAKPNMSFSLGKRLEALKQDKKPGPGAHNIDPANSKDRVFYKGRTPLSYSMGKRLDITNKEKIPAPNAYLYKLTSTKPQVPIFSMAQQIEVKENARSPGPAAHTVKHVAIYKTNPKYSIPGRSKIVDKEKIPASNAYNLSQYKKGKSAPNYSMGMKLDVCLPMIVPGDN